MVVLEEDNHRPSLHLIPSLMYIYVYDMLICEMFLKIVISIFVCVYVVIKFLINK